MANLLDQASIVLTPTAYDNGKVLCAKPVDGSGDFDFSRNSAATRINAQGLVEDVQILSSNLVQNGSFSQIGSEEVTNGNFSQQGSQLVTNGDFATDTNWVKGTGWSISGGSLNASNVNGISTTQAGYTFVGKTFKVSYTISDYSQGSAQIYLGGSQSTSLKSENGTHTEIISISSGNTLLYIYGISNFTGSIDNVSVVEVGQNWNLGTGWSIGDNKATTDGTINSNIAQDGVTIIGKTYKYSFDVLDSGAGVIEGRFRNGGGFIANFSSEGTYTGTFVAYNTFADFTTLSGNTASFSITNISVKEVGQNWSVTDQSKIEVGQAELISTDGSSQNISQLNTLVIGKNYRLQYDVLENNSGEISMTLSFGSDYGNLNSTIGTHTIDAIATNTTLQFKRRTGVTDITITNISVIEITDDTNLPRINYEGFSYQDVFSNELVTNGNFATDSDWNKNSNWSISGGTANCDGTSNGDINQGTTLATTGKSYKITYDVVSISQGEFFFKFGGVNGTFRNSIGTYTETIQAINNNRISLDSLNNANGSIDNVSVKEVTGQEVVPDSGCGSWLWEPQSTNIVTYSEKFSDSSWLKLGNRSQVTDNNVISPDGTQNASKVECIVATTNAGVRFVGLTIGVEYTFSLYAKKGNVGALKLDISDIATNFTLTDEWVRYEITETAVANFADFALANVLVGDFFYVWGAQLEEQTYATSYIPTDGTSVTRNRDLCTNGGSVASINSTEGVLYFETKTLVDGGDVNRYINISDGTSTNKLQVLYFSNGNVRFATGGTPAGFQTITLPNITQNNNNKIAVKYSANELKVFVNGTQRGVLSSNTSWANNTLNTIDFSLGGSSSPFFGKTKALAVWKEALTDTELQELTTI